MLTREENELLCRVEGNAPMGQIMRRHWIAACLSEEVAEPDGAPVRVKLLGESLVVFRDSKGRLGVLNEFCAHRRASNAFVSPGDGPCVTSPLFEPTMMMFLKTSGTPPQATPMSIEPFSPKASSSSPLAALSATRRRPTVITIRGAIVPSPGQ